MSSGKENFRADREAAEKIMALGPSREICRAHRLFLGRAVRFVARQGIKQFLDLGTGLPNMNNVHEVARMVSAKASVVYVDYDPVVIAHAQTLLDDDEITAVVQGDVRHPEMIIDHPSVARLIDFTQPVAVVMLGILHYLTDEEKPRDVVTTFVNRMAPGSYLIISHLTDDAHPEIGVAAREIYQDVSAPLVHRGYDEVAQMIAGLKLVSPGLTSISRRPDHETEPPPPGDEWWYVGIGMKEQT